MAYLRRSGRIGCNTFLFAVRDRGRLLESFVRRAGRLGCLRRRFGTFEGRFDRVRSLGRRSVGCRRRLLRGRIGGRRVGCRRRLRRDRLARCRVGRGRLSRHVFGDRRLGVGGAHILVAGLGRLGLRRRRSVHRTDSRRLLDLGGSRTADGRVDRRRRLDRAQGRRRSSRLGLNAWRQKPQRVDVPLLVGRRPDAEVHVWTRDLRNAARADRSDHGALRYGIAGRHAHGAEVQQRHRPPVGRPDRRGDAVRGERAGEGNDAGSRSHDEVSRKRGDVDTAMLAGVVWIGAEDERADDGAAGRPAPRRRGERRGEHEQQREPQGERAQRNLLLSELPTIPKLPARSSVVNSDYVGMSREAL